MNASLTHVVVCMCMFIYILYFSRSILTMICINTNQGGCGCKPNKDFACNYEKSTPGGSCNRCTTADIGIDGDPDCSGCQTCLTECNDVASCVAACTEGTSCRKCPDGQSKQPPDGLCGAAPDMMHVSA